MDHAIAVVPANTDRKARTRTRSAATARVANIKVVSGQVRASTAVPAGTTKTRLQPKGLRVDNVQLDNIKVALVKALAEIVLRASFKVTGGKPHACHALVATHRPAGRLPVTLYTVILGNMSL